MQILDHIYFLFDGYIALLKATHKTFLTSKLITTWTFKCLIQGFQIKTTNLGLIFSDMTVTSAPVSIQKKVDRPLNKVSQTMVPCCPKQSLRKNSCLTVQAFPLWTIFSLTYMPTGSAPSFLYFLQIASFAEHTPISWLGLFPHFEHIVCLDSPLPQPVSDVFLPGLLDVFTASIGNRLVLLPQRKTCCWWTVSDCRIHITALSRVRSPSNCSRSDNLLLRISATSISSASSLCRAPKFQYLAKANTSSTKDATGSPSSCLLWKKLTR